MTKENPYFTYCLACFILIGVLCSVGFQQTEISIALNGLNQHWLDVLCKYGTYLGDGFFALAIFLILLFFNRPLAFTLLISYLLGTGLVQLLKQTIFSDWFRPIQALEFHPQVHFVVGVEMHRHFSFPSGHTTSAFLLASFFACYYHRKSMDVLLFILALFVAFTRVYLLQHYLRDVLVGSINGSLFGWLGYRYCYENQFLGHLFSKKHHAKTD